MQQLDELQNCFYCNNYRRDYMFIDEYCNKEFECKNMINH